MTPSVRVDPQEQIILIFADLDNTVQIARLEGCIESQGIFLRESRVHPLKRPIEYVGLVLLVPVKCVLNMSFPLP
jgi:hypothetical protein